MVDGSSSVLLDACFGEFQKEETRGDRAVLYSVMASIGRSWRDGVLDFKAPEPNQGGRH